MTDFGDEEGKKASSGISGFLGKIGASKTLQSALRKVPRPVVQGVADVIGRGREGVMELGDGARIKYGLNDIYWTRYASNPRRYEPELWAVADRFLGKDTLFVDGGANIGFWSNLAAAKINDKEKVYAVEPGDSVLPRLKENIQLNGDKATLLPHALWSHSGETMPFMVSSHHAGNGIITEQQQGVKSVPVTTIAVDDIVDGAMKKGVHFSKVVVKLDVEGAEQQALEGAANTLKKHNTLLIYEDHAKDKSSETTAHYLAQGLHVYYIDPIALNVRKIEGVKDIEPIKKDIYTGHNFMACVPGSEFDRTFDRFCQEKTVLANNTPVTGKGR